NHVFRSGSSIEFNLIADGGCWGRLRLMWARASPLGLGYENPRDLWGLQTKHERDARAHIACATINYRMPTGKLHIVPLGGLGEFGMNCMAVRWGDDIIVIDGGLMFPEAELLGVDIVVPDISYLIENRQRVRGIILTHGHEDHIGGLPWILSELNVPVWGTEFTLAYVEDKLEEHGLLDDADLREIRAGERFKVGPFTIHPIHVTH